MKTKISDLHSRRSVCSGCSWLGLSLHPHPLLPLTHPLQDHKCRDSYHKTTSEDVKINKGKKFEEYIDNLEGRY